MAPAGTRFCTRPGTSVRAPPRSKLSSASLAYAARKAEELGVRNIEFMQGDILDLAALGTTFDVISGIGVLHHMADPARGLRCLIDRLAPGGYLMSGYTARPLAATSSRSARSSPAWATRPRRRASGPAVISCGTIRTIGSGRSSRKRQTSTPPPWCATCCFTSWSTGSRSRRSAGSWPRTGCAFSASRSRMRRRRTSIATPTPRIPTCSSRELGRAQSRHAWIFRGMYQFWTERARGAPA